MANRRMFSLDIVDTDMFLDMPVSTQALYFHLGMRADDDGFVSSPKRITGMIGASTDDLKLLVAKGFVIIFDSGIMVITHWKQNNYIRNDRYKKSVHQEEMTLLTEINNVYELNTNGRNLVDGLVDNWETQDRLGKDSIGKDSNTISSEPDKSTLNPSGILLPLNDNTYYDVPLEKIDTWVRAYQAVNVKQELQKMRAWLESNPTRRKTRRGIDRFINNWLSKEQDRGGKYNTCNNGNVESAQRQQYTHFDISQYYQ